MIVPPTVGWDIEPIGTADEGLACLSAAKYWQETQANYQLSIKTPVQAVTIQRDRQGVEANIGF